MFTFCLFSVYIADALSFPLEENCGHIEAVRSGLIGVGELPCLF